MTTVKAIQLVERFDTQKEADDCLNGVRLLTGFMAGRAKHSPSFGDKPYMCQAFFSAEEYVSPEAISSCYGLRIVEAPLCFLSQMIAQASQP